MIVIYNYLTQYVMIVDIQNRFINVQGINQYWFSWLLLCVRKISNENGCNTDLGIWILLDDHSTSLLNSICNNGGYMKQGHKRTRNKSVTSLHGFLCVLERYQMKNGCNTALGIWTLLGDHSTLLFNSICTNGGYTKQSKVINILF